MCPNLVQHGPWYNITIYTSLCGVRFEDLCVTARQDRHELVCMIDSNDKQHDTFQV